MSVLLANPSRPVHMIGSDHGGSLRMIQLKLRRTGNSLSTSWPKELLSRLNVKEGDRLFVVETRHGVMVTPSDPKFEATMQHADNVIERFKRAYKVLADN